MRPLLICLLLILATAPAQAVVWRGTIVDADSRQPIQGAIITNTLSQFFVLSNERGQFDIQGAEGETVSFQCPGYRTETHVILKGLEDIRLNFAMKLASKQLQEVVITQKYKTQYQRDSAERRVVQRSVLERHKSSIASPFSFAAERLSRSQRALFRFKKNYNRLEQEQYTDTRYSPELVASLTGLGGDTLAYFMNSHPMPYDYARAATALELKMWVRYQYKDFIRSTDSLRQLQLPY
ncbi:MAG: carboxypeptidase-like regulatory domain-containing protein [Chitinophagaceae bacterium]|nr:carboxypeptidase-like regulatory domain-containing protein [Chitinophagaceae bacterium]